jgi:hypothetical protein
MRPFTELPAPVEGGFARAIHWGPMPPEARATVIAAHGTTANSRSLVGIAEYVADDFCFGMAAPVEHATTRAA